MNCKEFSNLLDAWIDGALPQGEAERMQAHAEECGACASLYALRKDCRRLDEDVEVPDGFSSSWRQMIREEGEKEVGGQEARRPAAWKKWLAVAAALVFVVGGTLLSRGSLRSPASNSNAASSDSATLAEGADKPLAAQEERASAKENDAADAGVGGAALGAKTADASTTNLFFDAFQASEAAYDDAPLMEMEAAYEAALDCDFAEEAEELAAPEAAVGFDDAEEAAESAVPEEAAESPEAAPDQPAGYSLRDLLEDGLEFLKDMGAFLLAALPWLAGAAAAGLVIWLIVKKTKNRKNMKER